VHLQKVRFSTFIVRRKNTVDWQAGSPDIPVDRVETEYSVVPRMTPTLWALNKLVLELD